MYGCHKELLQVDEDLDLDAFKSVAVETSLLAPERYRVQFVRPSAVFQDTKSSRADVLRRRSTEGMTNWRQGNPYQLS